MKPSIIEAREKLRERLNERDTLERHGWRLPDLREVEGRMRATAKRLSDVQHPIPECWRDPEFEKCAQADVSKCPAACHRAALFHRCDVTPHYRKVLVEAGKPKFSVTLVLPQWRREVGELASFSVSGAQQKLRSLLGAIEGDPVTMVGGFEASLNTDLTGERFWQWHVHFIVAGVPKADLRRALMPPPEERASWCPRPLHIKKVRRLTRQLGYAMKGNPKARTAYVNKKRKKNQRGHRLDTAHQREHELYMARLTTERLLTSVGIRRVKGIPRLLKRQHS